MWDLFLHHMQHPPPHIQPRVETLEVGIETSRNSWGHKAKGMCVDLPTWENGNWATPSLCPQQHRKAAGEKKQWCGGSRQRKELK